MSITDPTPAKEFVIVAQVSLTIEADTAEEARQKAQDILDSSEGWPTADIEEVIDLT